MSSPRSKLAAPPAVVAANDILRVSIAREVLMAGIHANINRKDFVGMDLEAADQFAVKAADELMMALGKPT
jgi:hypothetical protein